LEQVRGTFERAGIEAKVHPDVRVPLWQKFMAICPAAGLSGVTRLPFGFLFGSDQTGELAEGLMTEVETVARAEGVQLPPRSATATFESTAGLAKQSPGAYPSLYYDLIAGRRLELDALNGAVVRLGQAHCLSTPLNFAIYAALLPFRDGAPTGLR
jgi:2-dehydropantoate 2-reductase